MTNMQFSHENVSFHNYTYNEHFSNGIYNLQLNGTSDSKLSNTGVANTFLRIIFVFISRLGFILVELGSIPIENVYKIVFYNIIEMADSIIAYALIGYKLSFGKWSYKGIVAFADDMYYNMELAIFGFAATLLGQAQISAFVVGRIHLCGSIILTFLYSALIQPMFMHWIWNVDGWMYEFTLLRETVPLKDHGGTLVMHISSCVIGIVGVIFLGRRIIRVSEMDEQSVGREHIATTVIGYIFIIFGYVSFVLPSPISESVKAVDNSLSKTLVNSLIALGSGTLTISLIELCLYRTASTYWNVLRCLQGGIAGLISVSAAVDMYSPLVCAGLASIASLVFLITSLMIHATALEDHCNFISSHLLCGGFGALMCPIFIKRIYLGNINRKFFILWQCVCFMIVATVSMVIGACIFAFFVCIKILRSKREIRGHNRAIALQRHLPKRPFFNRLFHVNCHTSRIIPGESFRRKYLETNTVEQGNAEGPFGDAKNTAL